MGEGDSEVGNKLAIDTACGIVHARGFLTGHNETWSDLQIVTWARDSRMRPGGRAQSYLDHYLQGSGQPLAFSLDELFSQDPGVRSRFNGKVNEVINSQVAQTKQPTGLKGIAPIPQSSFANIDWQYATGSLNISWECLGDATSNGAPAWLIEAWCQNEYRWHPEADRSTKCVHRAADNLRTPKTEMRIRGDLMATPGGVWPYARLREVVEVTNFVAAKNYWMVAPRTRVIVPKAADKSIS